MLFIEMWQIEIIVFIMVNHLGAGATFDWLFFDNSKLIDFDD